MEYLGLSLSNLQMQDYDGATISSGCRAGVHAKNPEKQIKALYRHYAGHSS